jgi:predicted ATP-binding protein involved in virulence
VRINKLELHNFRCFGEYELELSDRFTLLIGDNGSGKTAILDAISKCLDLFLMSIPNITSTKQIITSDDIRVNEFFLGQSVIMDKEQLSTKVAVTGVVNDITLKWGRSKEKGKSTGHRYSKALANLVGDLVSNRNSPDILFPIISYYKTDRLWKISDESIETLSPDSRLAGYKNCLNSSLKLKRSLLLRWFKTQELIALQKEERRHALEAVREAITLMIPDCQNVWWDMQWDELFIKIAEKNIPFRLLSDGYRNMIGMVADIAYRMATLNPQLEKDVIKQTEGIVLIDEIDLHLHPKWQGIVIERLLNIFPKVQFVASTHSPFIIQSLYHKKDCLLWDLEKNQPLEIDSKSIEDIAEDQQGVEIPQQSRRFLAMEQAAEEYYRVLKQIPPASEEEKQRLKQRLDELLFPYSDDPAYQAFLKIKRLAIENSEA